MKIKDIRVPMAVIIGMLLLTGCGSQAKSNSTASSKSSQKAVTSQQKAKKQSTGSQKASAKTTATLWNNHKDGQLATFINQWAPTVNQTYTKYDGNNAIKTSAGTIYPTDLSKVTVAGQRTSIGWSKDGKGSYAYDVVAIYNYNGTESSSPSHITYFFAFHKGKPVVLADQSNNKTPALTVIKNTKIQSNFATIAAGNSKLSDVAQTTTVIREPKLVGIMVYMKAWPDEDLTKETEFGVSINSNGVCQASNWGSATVVSYKIVGDHVNYWVKDVSSGKTTTKQKYTKHTVTLKELTEQYYTTASQKQSVQKTAKKAASIRTANW